jgi:hypothetical protein
MQVRGSLDPAGRLSDIVRGAFMKPENARLTRLQKGFTFDHEFLNR